MSEMKLIMENWRSHTQKQLLNEVTLADFKMTVSAIIQLKKGIEAGEISADIGGKVLKNVLGIATGGLAGAAKDIWGALIKSKDLGQLAKAGRLPDADTKNAPFLDIFNIEDEYSRLLDDKIENAFLNHLSDALEAATAGQGPLANMDLATWNINEYLEEFLKAKFNQKSVAGAPPKQIDSAKMENMADQIKTSGIWSILKKTMSAAADEG